MLSEVVLWPPHACVQRNTFSHNTATTYRSTWHRLKALTFCGTLVFAVFLRTGEARGSIELILKLV